MPDIDTLALDAVQIDDEFWSPRLETNRVVSLEHQYGQLQASGCLDNFRRIVEEAGGSFEGTMFGDSDVYKWLEAASYVLATHEMPGLADRVEDTIDLLARAQAEDGYLNTFFMLVQPDKRWTNLNMMHELYCVGHLIEAAVAHYEATGESTLLEVAGRAADHVDDHFGPDAHDGIPGHEGIELALVKLYRVTDERRYLELAEYFVDGRGRDPSPLEREFHSEEELGGSQFRHAGTEVSDLSRRHYLDAQGRYDGSYAQDHAPVREQATVEGHAVRATYLYAGVAALLGERDDPELYAALERLWTNMTTRRMYVTGGLGSEHEHEGFTRDYDLPNRTAYAETCAAVGSVLWCQRMFELTGEGQYVDVLERTLYNGVLTGVSLDGTRYCYANPLTVAGGHRRREWFYVACCPPNVSRLLASLGTYVYARTTDPAGLYVNLYVGSEARTDLAGERVRLTQRTEYPWHGDVSLEVSVSAPVEWTLNLRVPGWAGGVDLRVNGEQVPADPTDGYVSVTREWQDGDRVDLGLPLEVEVVEAHPDVRDDAGRVAIERGPVVYCLETTDNPAPVHRLILDDRESLVARHDEDLLDGVTVVEGKATVHRMDDWEEALYRPVTETTTETVRFTAVPYYAWGNRGAESMTVWMRRA
jgi:DUF1680 family protein